MTGDCQHVIFEVILNLLFPKLASPIPTIATPLNAKPPILLYFYPLYVKSHQDEQRTISPLEKTSVQLCLVSLWDIQPSIQTSALAELRASMTTTSPTHRYQRRKTPLRPTLGHCSLAMAPHSLRQRQLPHSLPTTPDKDSPSNRRLPPISPDCRSVETLSTSVADQ